MQVERRPKQSTKKEPFQLLVWPCSRVPPRLPVLCMRPNLANLNPRMFIKQPQRVRRGRRSDIWNQENPIAIRYLKVLCVNKSDDTIQFNIAKHAVCSNTCYTYNFHCLHQTLIWCFLWCVINPYRFILVCILLNMINIFHILSTCGVTVLPFINIFLMRWSTSIYCSHNIYTKTTTKYTYIHIFLCQVIRFVTIVDIIFIQLILYDILLDILKKITIKHHLGCLCIGELEHHPFMDHI